MLEFIVMTQNNLLYQGYMPSPIGVIKVVANELGITEIAFVDEIEVIEEIPNALVNKGLTQLKEYFAGDRKQFDLPMDAKGTDFRQQVWHSLCDIDYGQTVSYSDIANAVGRQKAVRAVGSANGANPIAIVVRCHRVIGKNGTLTGYASGLNRKQWLLDFERQ